MAVCRRIKDYSAGGGGGAGGSGGEPSSRVLTPSSAPTAPRGMLCLALQHEAALQQRQQQQGMGQQAGSMASASSTPAATGCGGDGRDTLPPGEPSAEQLVEC